MLALKQDFQKLTFTKIDISKKWYFQTIDWQSLRLSKNWDFQKRICNAWDFQKIDNFALSGVFFCKLASSVQIDEKSDVSEKLRCVWKAHCGLGPKNYSSLANDFIMRSCGL